MTSDGLDVRVEGITKQFGETRALSDVSLGVRPGSVHALVGENGAGKSTLGRIVSGVIRPDTGRILVDAAPIEFREPRDALAAGIATIAQEICLVPALNAIDNILLGIETSRLGLVRRDAMVERCRELADRVGFDIPLKRPVGGLSIAQQQQVEILRALSRDARLIVMDEPSARLSQVETGKLHEIVRHLKAEGRSVLLISHFLAEVLEAADDVTILRDGRTVRSSATSDETEETLVEGMLGRKVGAQFPPRTSADLTVSAVLSGAAVSRRRACSDASLELRPGEIVGLSGLVGAGRSELGLALAGAARASAGTIEIDGIAVDFRSPRVALRAGVFLLPESRRTRACSCQRSVRENVSVASLSRLGRVGFVRRERSVGSRRDPRRLAIVAASAEVPVDVAVRRQPAEGALRATLAVRAREC